MQVGDNDIGILVHPYSYYENEVDEDILGVPYYCDWIEDYKHLFSFSIAWKHDTSDDDISIWFNV
ncbi:TPA: hypothetical protein TXL63_001072 [Streptococcus suis]|nr:hypothetical protein [Streptococcus suis]